MRQSRRKTGTPPQNPLPEELLLHALDQQWRAHPAFGYPMEDTDDEVWQPCVQPTPVLSAARDLVNGRHPGEDVMSALIHAQTPMRFEEIKHPLMPSSMSIAPAGAPADPISGDPAEYEFPVDPALNAVAVFEMLRFIQRNIAMRDDTNRPRLRQCNYCDTFMFTPHGKPNTKYCSRSCNNMASVRRTKGTTKKKPATRKRAKKSKGGGSE